MTEGMVKEMTDDEICISEMDNPQRSFSQEKNVHRLTH
nr:MAG TPA: hypothetical protein [Caudoviricetes sp.]